MPRFHPGRKNCQARDSSGLVRRRCGQIKIPANRESVRRSRHAGLRDRFVDRRRRFRLTLHTRRARRRRRLRRSVRLCVLRTMRLLRLGQYLAQQIRFLDSVRYAIDIGGRMQRDLHRRIERRAHFDDSRLPAPRPHQEVVHRRRVHLRLGRVSARHAFDLPAIGVMQCEARTHRFDNPVGHILRLHVERIFSDNRIHRVPCEIVRQWNHDFLLCIRRRLRNRRIEASNCGQRRDQAEYRTSHATNRTIFRFSVRSRQYDNPN